MSNLRVEYSRIFTIHSPVTYTAHLCIIHSHHSLSAIEMYIIIITVLTSPIVRPVKESPPRYEREEEACGSCSS